MAKEKKLNFEDALSDLTTLVETMEKGDLALEASLSEFERGVKLIRFCQKSLEEAEQKIQILTKEGNLTDWQADD